MKVRILLLLVVLETVAAVSVDDSSSINFCAIGDWGGTELPPFFTLGQKETAQGMGKVAEDIQSQFVVALGDNFYHTGVEDTGAFRFDWTFENVYNAKSLTDIPWYVIGGNHDHYGNVTAQIEYSTKVKPQGRWKFPSLYHSHKFQSADGSVTLDLILIDTVDLCGLNDVQNEEELGYFDPLPFKNKQDAQKQWDWLEQEMKSSTADYLVVGGHYPVYSVCSHGPTESLVEHLRPLLAQYNAHYFSGHDHCMVHFEEQSERFNWDGTMEGVTVHHVLTGMGDECCYEATNLDDHSLNPPPGSLKWFLSAENKDLYKANGGFTSVQTTKDEMIIQYHDHQGNVVFTADRILPRKDVNN